ncbi:hypothetical protein L1987_35614 [Smallanthus sonchifolius]|uniref:Uncharacterized protein n=1 Tax=Smallanthus sonchifolius TaxID=185202 RepID=A0ACB9HDJ7_9ASTR|nr:hypothetical protein L1987_35614 [Smallanthus sonchifolius]
MGKLSGARPIITSGDIYTMNSERGQVREKKKTLQQFLINANELLNCIVEDDFKKGAVGVVPVPSDDVGKEEVIAACRLLWESPVDLNKDISSLIFAAPRYSEIPELVFDKVFVSTLAGELKLKVLKEIAKEY